MKGVRRAYYDQFSRFYDRFVALHSRDAQGVARKFLADRVPVQNGGSVLDICTGTATLLSHLQAKVGGEGKVVGVDFSHGMLRVAQRKTRSFLNVHLVEADAGLLPFAAGSFDAVTCSHAFYEIKGETANRALEEILRVLRPKGAFLMMEHDVPSQSPSPSALLPPPHLRRRRAGRRLPSPRTGGLGRALQECGENAVSGRALQDPALPEIGPRAWGSGMTISRLACHAARTIASSVVSVEIQPCAAHTEVALDRTQP